MYIAWVAKLSTIESAHNITSERYHKRPHMHGAVLVMPRPVVMRCGYGIAAHGPKSDFRV